MRTVVIMRGPSTDAGTFGTLVVDRGPHFASGELPWRDNHKDLSCIMAGAYLAEWALSPSKGWCYHIRNVPGRGDIMMHVANYCGDVTLQNPVTKQAYKSDLKGCIGVGENTGFLSQQKALLESHDAIQEFNDEMGRESFQLIIHDYQETVSSPLGGELD